MALGSLDEVLNATESTTHRADALEDILENNLYYHLSKECRQRVKLLFKSTRI